MVAGGSLSPLLGAVYLDPVDQAMTRRMEKHKAGYIRYMDDFVILATTRWQLRAAIREVMHVTAALGPRLHHRQKHFVGRIERGFDFLGYRFHPARRLRPSAESLRRLLARARRLHEQGAGGRRLWQYVARWTRWLWAGLGGMISR